MCSHLSKGLSEISTFNYIFIFWSVLMGIDGSNVEVIQVTQGRSFTLNCSFNTTSNSGNDIVWSHGGDYINGSDVFNVKDSKPNDGGIYVCSGISGNKTMYVIIGNKTVVEGSSFELHCGETNSSRVQNIVWTKNGEELINWAGKANFSVSEAQLADGGIYVCNNSGEVTQTNVVIGKKPSLPPEPECLNSSNTRVQCKAYPGEFLHANSVCLSVIAVGAWGFRTSICNECFRGNETVTCTVDFADQYDRDYDVTTEIRNYVMPSKRSVSYKNLQKKVIPDQPTVVNMTATGLRSFTTWFRVPATWDEKNDIFARGQYTQDGETRIINHSRHKNKFESYTGQYGKFQFNTAERNPYSLVCWKIQIRFDYGFDETTWSSPSEPVCEYTFMLAPSEKPEELNTTSEQDKEYPDLRNVTFTWKPPPEEYRNGIIDHYLLVLQKEGLTKEEAVTIRNETIPGSVTNITFIGIESYETFSAELTAWTKVGQSPPVHAVIKAVPRSTAGLQLMLGITITICAIIFLIIFGRITCIMRQTVSADHLPEPYFIPEEKMKHCLAQKRCLPRQKEVFDTLKGKREEFNICDPSFTPSRQMDTLLRSSITSSDESQDSSTYRSSSGASCYMLISSTADSARGTDDASDKLINDSEIESQPFTETNSYAQDDMETVLAVGGDFNGLKVIADDKMYGEFGCCDPKETICQENGPYENCNSILPQENLIGDGRTLQPCNDTENPEYNFIASRNGDDDRGYENYTSFKLRVHDTMTKLNVNKEDI